MTSKVCEEKCAAMICNPTLFTMSNHTLRFGLEILFEEFHFVFMCDTICLPSTALLLYSLVLLQTGKNCCDCLREGDDVRITAGNHLVASCVKSWHVGCAMRRRREIIERSPWYPTSAPPATVRRRTGTIVAALHLRSAPATALPGASNSTIRTLQIYVFFLRT